MMGWIAALSITLWRHPEKVDSLDLDALSSPFETPRAVQIS